MFEAALITAPSPVTILRTPVSIIIKVYERSLPDVGVIATISGWTVT